MEQVKNKLRRTHDVKYGKTAIFGKIFRNKEKIAKNLARTRITFFFYKKFFLIIFSLRTETIDKFVSIFFLNLLAIFQSNSISKNARFPIHN